MADQGMKGATARQRGTISLTTLLTKAEPHSPPMKREPAPLAILSQCSWQRKPIHLARGVALLFVGEAWEEERQLPVAWERFR